MDRSGWFAYNKEEGTRGPFHDVLDTEQMGMTVVVLCWTLAHSFAKPPPQREGIR